MKTIKCVTCNEPILVDDEDYEELSKHRWWHTSTETKLLVTRVDKLITPLVVYLMSEYHMDHKDRNTHNNQKDNLRLATRSQNACNKAVYKNSSSGYKGVHWTSFTGKWRAMIKVDGKSVCLGYFSSKHEAAHAYNSASKKYHGEFGYQNIVQSTTDTLAVSNVNEKEASSNKVASPQQ